MVQENQISEHLTHSQLTRCKSSGRFPRTIYVLAVFLGIYLFTLSTPGIVIGIIITLYAINCLLSSRNLQALCPNCQKLQSKLRSKTKSFSCATCGHKLCIYGTELTDISSDNQDVKSLEQGRTSPSINKDIKRDIEFIKRFRMEQIVGSIAFIILIYWCFAGNGLNFINHYIANNISDQYEIAKRHGNKMDMCVQAGATAISYLNAHDEQNYARWKSIEEADCQAAGLR